MESPIAEELSWTNLCARAEADLQRSLFGSTLTIGLRARYERKAIEAMQALQPLLKNALDKAEHGNGVVKPVRRKYPADVVDMGKRSFILELNRRLPAPFCAWDASEGTVFWYEVRWRVPNDRK